MAADRAGRVTSPSAARGSRTRQHGAPWAIIYERHPGVLVRAVKSKGEFTCKIYINMLETVDTNREVLRRLALCTWQRADRLDRAATLY